MTANRPRPVLTRTSPPSRTQRDYGRVRLRRLDGWQADNHRQRLADLHAHAYRQELGEEQECGSRADFLHRLADDTRRPGFDMVFAARENLVGCAYGFPVDRDGTWWQGLLAGLPPGIGQLTASGNVFAIAELMVHPRFQRRGVGRSLHHELLTGLPPTLGAALVNPADLPAWAALRSWGWQDIGEVRTEPGAPVRHALIRLLEQDVLPQPRTSARGIRGRNPE